MSGQILPSSRLFSFRRFTHLSQCHEQSLQRVSPKMYHKKAKEKELDASIPYLRHAVQPFLQRLLDSLKTVPQYCTQNDRHGWRKLFPGGDKYAFYSEVFPQCANGFEFAAPAILWSIPVLDMNKFYRSESHPLHAPPPSN